MGYPTDPMNGLKFNATSGFNIKQLNPATNLQQALQGYMPQTLAANGANGGFGQQDYSLYGGTQVPQMGGLNVSNLAPGAGGYNMTNPIAPGGGTGTASAGGNWYDGAFGKDGWGGLALNAATGLAGTYLGLKQYGLAKDMFAENKSQYAQNFDAQRGLTNSRLEDRQTRRNIERPDSMAAADYMSKYGVK
tara:strand:- start:5651 stop:6223 length:573 start_codon:yes stop_codon:yes gene_type:complete